MTDRPIIFSAPMVRALLDGRKTMTRRLAWRWPASFGDSRPIVGDIKDCGDATPWQLVKSGDRLWVRESLQRFNREPRATAQYVATITPVPHRGATDGWCDGRAYWIWKNAALPSIHMPRFASRLTLVVEATRIEKLQKISEADCLAEGPVIRDGASWIDGGTMVYPDPSERSIYCTPRTWFRETWDNLHGREDSWDANPEVVALTFTVHNCHIEDLKPEEKKAP